MDVRLSRDACRRVRTGIETDMGTRTDVCGQQVPGYEEEEVRGSDLETFTNRSKPGGKGSKCCWEDMGITYGRKDAYGLVHTRGGKRE